MLNCLKFGQAIPWLQHKSANTLACLKRATDDTHPCFLPPSVDLLSASRAAMQCTREPSPHCEDKCHIGPLTSCILQVIIFDIIRVVQGAQ